MNDTIHGSVERLSRLHPAIEQPSPTRLFLDFSIRRLPIPRDVPPEDRLVEWRRFPDRAGINAVVEEYDERAAPVTPDCNRTVPTPWPFHLVSRKVESIDFRFGQVVPARYIALFPWLRKPRRRLDEFLLPSP